MSEPSIDTPAGLVKPADPASGQKTQFALFSDSWIELQGYVGSALELPLSQGDFEQKYGTVGSSGAITDCIAAMRGVHEAATEFGNPKTLRAALINNPNILSTKEPPAEIYTHTVWLGQRVHETAGRLVTGYESVLAELPGLPAREQVENLKAYLFDETLGPIPLANQMSKEVGALITKLGLFEQKMDEYNDKFKAFTRASSGIREELNSSIGALAQKIEDLEKSRDEAYKAWQDFTIAASTTTVGCFLIGALLAPVTGGLSLLVGTLATIATGVGLGIRATQCRTEYNEYCRQIQTAGVTLQKKQRLRSDLGDFDKKMGQVGPAMATFMKNLQNVEGVWVQMNADMLAIGSSITESNVGSMPFLVKTKARVAIDSWKGVDDAARQFTAQSLVDYTSIAFGDPMPQDLPNAA